MKAGSRSVVIGAVGVVVLLVVVLVYAVLDSTRYYTPAGFDTNLPSNGTINQVTAPNPGN